VVLYARSLGIRVLAEFDAPAHASSGWQFGPESDMGELVVCDRQDWDDGDVKLAAEPNAGQLNPLNTHVYAVLENLYEDFVQAFSANGAMPLSMFHMGGDEVNFYCWAQSQGVIRWLEENG